MVISASGIVRAAAYIAKMADASVGVAPLGRTSSGFTKPAMEKPLATRTFRAVRAGARPMVSADRRDASGSTRRKLHFIERGAHTVGEFCRVVIGPEVHEEKPRFFAEHVVVQRSNL